MWFRLIILAELVFVVTERARRWLDRNLSEANSTGAGPYLNDVSCVVCLKPCPGLTPYVLTITAGRNAVNRESTVRTRHCVVGCAEGEDYCSHLRVDIAEDVGDAFAIESHGAAGAGLVESQIKALAVEERKNVVKEGVSVGKFNACPCRHNEQVWMKLLVLLEQAVWRM